VNDVSDPLMRAFAPQSHQNREQRVTSIVTGIVDTIEDDGTYRLKLFGMNGQEEDMHSAPARVAMPGAGGHRGVHFFPEQGDEVVVAFEAGDTNHPIIIGALWNRDSRPPEQANQSARNDVRTIVTRSGHELTFDDTPGRPKVTLRSQAGSVVILNDASGGEEVRVATPQGRRVTINDTPPGSLTIETPTCEVALAEPGVVRIRATVSITLEAPIVSIAGSSVTVGTAPGSAIVEGLPFSLHTHAGGTLPTGTTGPVVP